MKMQYEGTFKITKVAEGNKKDFLRVEEINSKFIERLQEETGGVVEVVEFSLKEVKK